MSEPNATGRIEIAAPPEKVYSLVSDPAKLAELAAEYAGHSWLDGASGSAVGARFRGRNQRGVRRWNTVSRITDADAGSRFAFEVTSFGQPVARWQYDIEAFGDRSVVTESTWDQRTSWFKAVSSVASGVWQRDDENRANIETTLSRLKTRIEADG